MSETANHYDVKGERISGTIDTTSLTGEPVISLTVDGRSVDKGSLETRSYGIEVTALVDAVPDSYSTQLTLVVPEVNVERDPVRYTSYAVLTKIRTTIGGPGLVQGVIQSYDVRTVHGEASLLLSLTADGG